MEKIPLHKLIKTGLSTVPIIALLLITPVYLLTSKIHNFNFFLAWLLISFAVSLAWTLNLAFIVLIKRSWILSWVRVVIVGALMYIISFCVLMIIDPEIEIDKSTIEIIRLSNILAVNTIIHILIILTITQESKNKFALENSNLKLANLEAEYKLLKDQINPHFLFNALGTAKALIKKQPLIAEEYLLRLSDFLRASINNNHKTVLVKDELNLCDEFIALHKMRFGDALKYTSTVDALNSEKYFIPHFSILSLIENAIKHNASTLESPLEIRIYMDQDFLNVKNNKQKKFVMESSLKTGLKNLNNRYNLLNSTEIVIHDNDKEFWVQIPLLKK
ncbi:MAG: histidine kinase [Bacteroidetes bacterium]|nr:histidine kinase [Bacteroidota bacterium]